MTPAERVVVEAAVRWAPDPEDDGASAMLMSAVDALLAERAGPQPETVEITWGQVAEGDQIYRAPNGAPVPPGAPGKWFEVTNAGPLAGTNRVRIRVKGIGKPIQPEAGKAVTVKRGATGQAVDTLGAVLWSGTARVEVRDLIAAAINDPVSEES